MVRCSRATYESGAGTRYLVFVYGVARGDTDADGVALCSDTMMDANCGLIALERGVDYCPERLLCGDGTRPARVWATRAGTRFDGTPTRVRGLTITSTPTNATPGYAEDETIRVRLDFAEAVSVAGTGTPSVVLNIGRAARRAVYASGSGTRYLNFEYTVQAGDFDSDGISLCSDTFLDSGCGRISLNGGSISAQSDSLAAELDLPALGNQSGHKVDATPNFIPNPVSGRCRTRARVSCPGIGRSGRAASGEESFRLLFVSSTTRNATSSDINDYNNHVIAAAGAGHSAIQGVQGRLPGHRQHRDCGCDETTPGSPGPGCRSTGWAASTRSRTTTPICSTAHGITKMPPTSWATPSPRQLSGPAAPTVVSRVPPVPTRSRLAAMVFSTEGFCRWGGCSPQFGGPSILLQQKIKRQPFPSTPSPRC